MNQPEKPKKLPEGHVNVETTGGFGLIDITTGAEVAHDGPSIVPDSPFIRDRLELGQLKLVS
jgi:hypothetical protein